MAPCTLNILTWEEISKEAFPTKRALHPKI